MVTRFGVIRVQLLIDEFTPVPMTRGLIEDVIDGQ
jgi:hypothetical protein